MGSYDIQRYHAHTFDGLCTRLLTKLTAHTLSIHINRLLGNPDCLQIKSLAFPNYHNALLPHQFLMVRWNLHYEELICYS